MGKFSLVLIALLAAGCDPDKVAHDSTVVADSPEPTDTGTEPLTGCDLRWSEVTADPATVYVDASAAPDGDGTAEHPFLTINQGLGAVSDGATVAVAAGLYQEVIYLRGANTAFQIVGRCLADVVLDASTDDEFPPLYVRMGATVSIEQMTLTGGTNTGMWVDGGNVNLTDVAIVANEDVNVYATDGSTLNFTRVDITDGLPSSANPRNGGGSGLWLFNGSTLDGDSVRILNNTGVGAYVSGDGSRLTVSDSEIGGTLYDDKSDYPGFGVWVVDGGMVEILDGSQLYDNGCVAVLLDRDDEAAEIPSLTMTDSDILSARSEPWGSEEALASGVAATDAASIVIERAVISGTPYAAVIGGSEDSPGIEFELIDVTLLAEGEDWTGGILAVYNTTVVAERLEISGSIDGAVAAVGDGANITVTDIDIHDIAPTEGRGWTVTAQDPGSELILHGGSVDTVVGFPISAADGGSVELHGTALRANVPLPLEQGQDTPLAAMALAIDDGSLLLDGVTMEDVVGLAVVAFEGSVVDVIDSTISGVVPSAKDNQAFAFWAAGDAGTKTLLTVTDTVASGTEGIVLVASGPDTSVTVSSSIFYGNLASPLLSRQGTYGVLVSDGADVTLESSEISSQAGWAVVVDSKADVEAGTWERTSSATVTIDDLIIEDVYSASQDTAAGLVVLNGGTITASLLSISGIEGPGIFAEGSSAQVQCSGCEISDTEQAAVVGRPGSEIALDASHIDATGAELGVFVSSEGSASALESTNGTTIEGAGLAGIYLHGDGSYLIEETSITNTTGVMSRDTLLNGNAIFAVDGVTTLSETSGLSISDSAFRSNAGPALLLAASGATIGCNDWTDNTLDLASQYCSESPSPTTLETDCDDAPADELCTEDTYGYASPDSFDFFVTPPEVPTPFTF